MRRVIAFFLISLMMVNSAFCAGLEQKTVQFNEGTFRSEVMNLEKVTDLGELQKSKLLKSLYCKLMDIFFFVCYN